MHIIRGKPSGLGLTEEATPDKPDEGDAVIYVTNSDDDYGSSGDVVVASTHNSVTTRTILFNYSDGDVW